MGHSETLPAHEQPAGARRATDTPMSEATGDDAGVTPTAGDSTGRTRPGRRAWWVTFLLITALGCLWALASPLFSVPDEPAHTIRAAAAARGQILPGERTERGFSAMVEVPAIIAKSSAVPVCYLFRGDIPAGCAMSFSGSTRTVPAETNAGFYPPVFYAVVGAPSVPFPSATGIYLMRGVSAAICGALLASAVASALALRRPRLLVTGIAFAVTPMVLFLAGSINPNGVEIAAAVCLWVSLGVALTNPDGARGRLMTRVGVSGSILALSRPLSPMFVALIGAALLIMFGWRPMLDLVRDRRGQIAAAAVALASLSTLVWVTAFGTLDQTPGGGVTNAPLLHNVRLSAGKIPVEVDQMIGVFGWLDTGAATVSVYAWLFGVATLLLVGLASSGRREAAVLIAIVVAVVALPVALEAPRAATQGFPWQGRYTLPLAVGLPILSSLQVDRARLLPGRMVRSLSATLLALFVAGQLYAHFWSTRRYTAGVKGTLNWLTADGWHPAVPVWLLFAGFVVTLALTAGWLQRLVVADLCDDVPHDVPHVGDRPDEFAGARRVGVGTADSAVMTGGQR
jgi:Predicted membrane protein (DUF2142)